MVDMPWPSLANDLFRGRQLADRFLSTAATSAERRNITVRASRLNVPRDVNAKGQRLKISSKRART